MAAVALRLALLTIGMGAVEIGIGSGLVEGSLAGWGLVFLVGLPAIVAGSAGFIGPLIGAKRQKGSTDA